jgi:hypothetical protein
MGARVEALGFSQEADIPVSLAPMSLSIHEYQVLRQTKIILGAVLGECF